MGQGNGQKFWDYISIAHTIILLLHERGKIMLHYNQMDEDDLEDLQRDYKARLKQVY